MDDIILDNLIIFKANILIKKGHGSIADLIKEIESDEEFDEKYNELKRVVGSMTINEADLTNYFHAVKHKSILQKIKGNEITEKLFIGEEPKVEERESVTADFFLLWFDFIANGPFKTTKQGKQVGQSILNFEGKNNINC